MSARSQALLSSMTSSHQRICDTWRTVHKGSWWRLQLWTRITGIARRCQMRGHNRMPGCMIRYFLYYTGLWLSIFLNLKLKLWKDHELLDKLAKHTELLTGLKIKNQLHNPHVSSSEPWQIGVYGPGGHFMPHFDGFQQVGPAMGSFVSIHLITGGHRWVWSIPPLWAWNMGGQPRSYCFVLPLQRPWWLHSISWHGGCGQAQCRICSVLVQSWQAKRNILSTSIL